MYIKSAKIENIRSIDNFRIDFENPAGWHVLIGDNGSGKSTIIRSIALALVGPNEAQSLLVDWQDWLKNNESKGRIELQIEPSADTNIDEYAKEMNSINNLVVPNILTFEKQSQSVKLGSNIVLFKTGISPYSYNWGDYNNGWFSAAYGPYRRFSGGDPRHKDVFDNRPKLGAHLSVFSEDVALTEPINWLIDQFKNVVLDRIADKMVELKYGKKPGNNDSNDAHVLENITHVPIIDDLKKLINSSDFLPNGIKLASVSQKGVFFKDGNENSIMIDQLSDGYRSILSLTLELIRQLIKVFGEDNVFKNIREDKIYIDLPGVVLIDEIDAHLHPTWQTKIGQWFLKYFPNIQFIVTTHSPLVCRAAEKGTIWKLAAPGSSEKSEQVTGIDRNRLIYGNVLDAYGTEEFGIVDNIQAVDKKEELIQLSKKQIVGKTSLEEENKLKELRAIFSTDAFIEL